MDVPGGGRSVCRAFYSGPMSVDPREGLERLRRLARSGELDALCERRGIVLLSVFGSATRPEGQPADLDVAVAFDRAADPDLVGLTNELIEVTGVEALDLMDLRRAGHIARERALVGAVGLFEAAPGGFARAQMAAATSRMDTDWLRRLDLKLMAG